MFDTQVKSNLSKGIILFNKVRLEMEKRFYGLPHAHITLIQYLITRADPCTGFVENLTYNDLSILLKIEISPGRSSSGTLKKATIRSYLKTIADHCKDDFKIATEGQQLKIHFLKLPSLYATFLDNEFDSKELNTGLNSDYFIENKEEKHLDKGYLNREISTELLTAEGAVKNNNIINNKHNKHNKQTRGFGEQEKRPIAPNFYPDEATIALALAYGYERVLDTGEIAKFIQHNQKNHCQWEDFNPVYLTWLQRGAEYRQMKKKSSQQPRTKGFHHARSSYQANSFESLLQAVLQQNPNPCNPNDFEEHAIFDKDAHLRTHGLVVGETHGDLRAVIYQ